eukprot:6208297-Pleurochrysis_carterae.AAC.2
MAVPAAPQGCGPPALAQAARRRLLRRLLVSLQRSSQRVANDPAAFVSRLRMLCHALRVHMLQPITRAAL